MIQRSLNGVDFAPLTTVAAGITSHSDTGLLPATTYWYRVVAQNAYGDSEPSVPASATTPNPPPTPPLPPDGLTAQALSTHEIALNWSDNSGDEDGFKVERSSNGADFVEVAAVNADATSYTDSGLFPGTPYWYRIRAYNVGGHSAYSDLANVLTLPPFTARVNFQTPTGVVPDGYLKDDGAAFGDRGNGYRYGWNARNFSYRDRDSSVSPDQRYDTLIHMQQYGTFTWEIEVPNGSYRVKVVSGDPSFFPGFYRLSVEGVVALEGTTSSTQRWFEGEVTVVVSDGRLTVGNAPGALDNKINFIEVTEL
jgi:hypothetical protein